MQFGFGSAFLLHFFDIHRIDGSEGHFCDTLILRVGIFHIYLYFIVNLTIDFNLGRLELLLILEPPNG